MLQAALSIRWIQSIRRNTVDAASTENSRLQQKADAARALDWTGSVTWATASGARVVIHGGGQRATDPRRARPPPVVRRSGRTVAGSAWAAEEGATRFICSVLWLRSAVIDALLSARRQRRCFSDLRRWFYGCYSCGRC